MTSYVRGLRDEWRPSTVALVLLVAPPRARAATFSTISVFAVPGIVVFLPVICAVSTPLASR